MSIHDTAYDTPYFQLKQYECRLLEKEREYEEMEMVAGSLRLELEDSRQSLQKLERLREAMLSLASSGN